MSDVKKEYELIKELTSLNAKRSLFPSFQDRNRTEEVLNELYELTKNPIWKLKK